MPAAAPPGPPAPPPASPAGSAARQVTANFLNLGLGEAAARGLSFVATLYLARQLGAAGYGAVGFAAAMVLYAAALADLGVEMMGPREVAHDREGAGRLASSLTAARLAWAAVLAAALALLGRALLPPAEARLLALYGLTLFTTVATPRWVYVGLERTALVSLARVLAEAGKAGLILALVHGPDDLLRVPLAQLAGEGAAVLLLLAALPRAGVRLRPRMEPALVRSTLARSFPLLLSHLLALLLYNADVVLLRVFRVPAEVGLYVAAYTLLGFLGVMGEMAGTAMVPTLTRLHGDAGGRRELFATATARLFALGLPVAAGGALLAPQIVGLLFGAEYLPAAPIFVLLICSTPLLLLRSAAQGTLIAAGRQHDVLRMTALAAAVNVGLNLLTIPRWGMAGAAAATLAADALRTGAALVYAGRTGVALPGAGRLLRVAAATAAMAGVLLAVRPAAAWTGVPLGMAAYAAALAVLGGVRLRRGEAPALTV